MIEGGGIAFRPIAYAGQESFSPPPYARSLSTALIQFKASVEDIFWLVGWGPTQCHNAGMPLT